MEGLFRKVLNVESYGGKKVLWFSTDNIGWLQDTLVCLKVVKWRHVRESGHMSHNPVTAICSLATLLQPVSTNSSIFHSGKHPATIQLMNDYVSFTPSFPTHGPQLFPHGPLCSRMFFSSIWHNSFSLAPQFDKAYAYSIRHMFGKEGKRTDYTPYSCMKVILSNPPSQGDYHGEQNSFKNESWSQCSVGGRKKKIRTI